MEKFYIDYETYSEAKLKDVGAWMYSRHPSTTTMCLGVSTSNSSVCLKSPRVIRKVMEEATSNNSISLHAWNSFFEYAITQNVVLKSRIPPTAIFDSSVKAAYRGFPRSLEKCSESLNASTDLLKDKGGSVLIRYLSKPTKTRRNFDLKKYNDFGKYCVQDARVLKFIDSELGNPPDFENGVYKVHMHINSVGFKIDRDLSILLSSSYSEYKDSLDKHLFDQTGLHNTRSTVQVLNYLNKIGLKIDNLRKNTIIPLLNDPSLSEKAILVLRTRINTSKSSYKKIDKVDSLIDSDDRMRGMFKYFGANTGRWTGWKFQPQNLPRGSVRLDPKIFEATIHSDNLKESVDSLHIPLPEFILSSIRKAIIPSDDNIFICADYSSIEPRVLWLLCDDADSLRMVREGYDLYTVAASKLYKIAIDKISKSQRSMGKTLMLALGYQSGVVGLNNAFISNGMVDLTASPEELDKYKKEGFKSDSIKIENLNKKKYEWRDNNPLIVELWETYSSLFKKVFEEQKLKHGYIVFERESKSSISITLPSGRSRFYNDVAISDDEISYVEHKPGRSIRSHLYGGKIVENVVQSIARDILADAMVRLHAAGHKIVMTVHDEVVIEGKPEDMGEIVSILETPPTWLPDIPLKVDAKICNRYEK